MGYYDEDSQKWIPVDAVAIKSNDNRYTADDISSNFISLQQDNKKISKNIEQLGYNIKTLGAKGNGIDDDTVAFINSLEIAKTQGYLKLFVPAGTYNVSNRIRIYKNTTIVMDAAATIKRAGEVGDIFINGEYGNPNYSYGFSGDGNITIEGGCIDTNGFSKSPSGGTCALQLAHADNIRINKVKFKNNYRSHFIELNACKNVKIQDCEFVNHMFEGIGGYEAIQIDMSYADGFHPFGSWDDTPCNDITIENCKFRDGWRGVGSHYSKYYGDKEQNGRVFHTNINILNNNFENMIDNAINCESYIDSKILGNSINGTQLHGIGLSACTNVLVDDNIIVNTKEEGIHVTWRNRTDFVARCKDIEIGSNNIIKNCGKTGINATGVDGVRIHGTTLINNGYEGISINDCKDVVVNGSDIRGASLTKEGLYSAIRIGLSEDVDIKQVSSKNSKSKYSNAILVKSDCKNIAFSNLNMEEGVNTLIFDETGLSSLNNEQVLINGGSYLTGDTVTLRSDISKYTKLSVMTGTRSSGNLSVGESRSWIDEKFVPNSDYINVPTSNGRLIAKIIDNYKIQILRADDPLRYIWASK